MLTLIAVTTGLLFGFIGGSAIMLIPWGIAGLVIGYFSPTRKLALLNGFVFGFLLAFFFMINGYTGSTPLLSRVPPFAVLGLFGGLCGIILGLVGSIVSRYILVKNIIVKKPWFHPKKYGYGWGMPAIWQGWVILLGYIAFILYDFLRIDRKSHSASDTLLNFIPQIILASIILFLIVRITSGKPKWHWGKKKQ